MTPGFSMRRCWQQVVMLEMGTVVDGIGVVEMPMLVILRRFSCFFVDALVLLMSRRRLGMYHGWTLCRDWNAHPCCPIPMP